MAAFDADTAVAAVGPGRYRGMITSRWHIGTVPNGGYVLAVVLDAVRQEIGEGHPLTVTAHYLSPCSEGEVDVEVEVLKRGRSLSTVTARLVQGGRTRIAALATYGELVSQAGPTLTRAAAPDLPDPERCATRGSALMAINHVIDFRPSPDTARWLLDERGYPAEIEGWIRFADGRPPDVHSLPMLCDAMPPAIFAAIRTGWVPTLELTVHVRGVPEPDWLRARVSTRVLVDGLCEEDCELWDTTGRLVAMSRQLARVLPDNP